MTGHDYPTSLQCLPSYWDQMYTQQIAPDESWWRDYGEI